MLYEGGMQKMLTSVEATGGPPVVTPVAGEPVSKIVRATSAVVKAPEVRCPQLVKLVTVAQSAFMLAGLHCTGRHGAPLHVLHGGPGWQRSQPGLRRRRSLPVREYHWNALGRPELMS